MLERAIADIIHDPVGWGMIAILIGSLVLAFPWRHRHTIVSRRTYPYKPAAVWQALRMPPPKTISETQDQFDPEVWILTLKRTLGGAGAPPIVVRVRRLLEDAPHRHVVRIEEIGGRRFPYGEDSTITEALRETAQGTEAIVVFDGALNTSLHALAMRMGLRRVLANVANTIASKAPSVA